MIPTDVRIKEKELYQEIDLYIGNNKVGEAEVDVNGHSLTRFKIYDQYQNKGYGTRILKELIQKYMITNLWVEADNERAIHVYEKFDFEKVKPTMYEMRVK